ncbi:hypothetical protein [Sandaracinus amylolyticus]|uniref:Uncharacterized protein n=1 Tax=Sandaracinus amylolyticus TaxID=927083 RepID=A0A0F6SHK2_9BACT|nr:hypothetical protein [Sandaracinus amylolyticus]AKF10589.1 hypothetical protein DB32_007738 [Sandaracinus amylolyticus]
MSHPDQELVARQLRGLTILDEAHRATTRGSATAGLVFLGLGLAFPAMKIAAIAALSVTWSPFLQRAADIPIWVVAIMIVCGGGIGAYALVNAWKLRAAGSPVLAHLRANADDPLVDMVCQVVVHRGHRTAYFDFTTRRGRVLREVVTGALEGRVADAASTCVPRSR